MRRWTITSIDNTATTLTITGTSTQKKVTTDFTIVIQKNQDETENMQVYRGTITTNTGCTEKQAKRVAAHIIATNITKGMWFVA